MLPPHILFSDIDVIAGIPTVIKPFFGDQFFWADRVEALGVGSGVRKLTVTALAEAFITATTDPKQISRAKLLGERIRAVSTWNLTATYAVSPRSARKTVSQLRLN